MDVRKSYELSKAKDFLFHEFQIHLPEFQMDSFPFFLSAPSALMR